jgi:Ca-activated chloride channel family protein
MGAKWQSFCFENSVMNRRIWLVAALCGFVAVQPVLGQKGHSARDDSPGYRFGLDVDAVHLVATVVDKRGRLVTGLEEVDFVVYEDGVPQELAYFARGTDAPVDVMLLVDGSGSMDMVSKVANAKNAAIQLISVLEPEDRVAVYAFDQDIIELSTFTEDKAAAIQALQRLEPFGSTAIYDAVAEASDLIRGLGFGRRAIALISDGIDTSSELSIDKAVEFAKGVDLPVYVIRVLSPLDDPENDAFLGVHGRNAKRGEALERFAAETGGKLYEGSQLGVLRLASLRVKEELKTQYRLGYVPRNSKRDGQFRQIEVFVRQDDVEVRTRKGYYARAQGGASTRRKAVTVQDLH